MVAPYLSLLLLLLFQVVRFIEIFIYIRVSEKVLSLAPSGRGRLLTLRLKIFLEICIFPPLFTNSELQRPKINGSE